DGVTGNSTTDAGSEAAFTAPAGTVPQTISVTAKASSSDPGQSATVEYGMDMSSLKVNTLVASPTSILANGTDTSTLTATVTDGWGNPAPAGIAVSWSTDLGVLIAQDAETNSSGKALATLQAGTVTGSAT